MRTCDPRPASRVGVRLAVLAWLGLCACHHQLPRLSARGQHAEVAERAAQARVRPKRKAARAWASSLVALGRVEEARSVLLRDFRTTAGLPSLVALADLEMHEGLRGVAAAHYARAASLEVDPLRGREDVCALFRDRAGRFFDQGEAAAADLDMRRISVICPRPRGRDAAATQAADRSLHLRITAAAKTQAQAQRTLAGCQKGECRAPAADAEQQRLAGALSRARITGPDALRQAARALGVQLAPGDVASLLAAELRGELGLDIVTHDELRAWIGEAAPAAIHDSVTSLPPVEQTYTRLRLAQLGPDYELPGGDAARSTASLVVKLLELFDDDPDAAAMSWRVFVLVGDLPSAELALTAGLGVGTGRTRPGGPPPLLGELKESPGAAGSKDKKTAAATTPGPKDSRTTGRAAGPSGTPPNAPFPPASPAAPDRSGPPGTPPAAPVPPAIPAGPGFEPSQVRVPVPSLWSARRRVDADSLPKLLLLARLRALGGRDDQALEITLFALAEAHAQGLPGVEAMARAEGHRHLAAGEPWAALAIASAVPGVATADLSHAAGAAIVLGQAACAGGCSGAESARDRVAARQVLGEAWLTAQEARARELAFARERTSVATAGCTELGELLAPGARGPLASALSQSRDELTRRPQRVAAGTGPKGQVAAAAPAPGPATLEARSTGEALRRAIEADPTLACAGRLVAPLLYAGDHRVAAAALADQLSHAPQEIAAGVLALQSELALGLGRRDQADQMLIAAAAASADPRAVWLRAARLGALVDARHYQLLALRQGLMHIPAAEAAPLRLALVVRSLRDANDAWAVRESEVGREALLRGVESYLEGEAPARRWQAREDLANALAEHRWADLEAALLIRAALWPEPGLQRQHPAAAARLERALGGVADPPSGSPLAPAELAAALAAPKGPAPELPAAALAFVPVDQLEGVRLEIVRHHPDPLQRRRVAIALASSGSAPTRAEALRLLLAELARTDPARRDAVTDLLLVGLAAASDTAEPMVATSDDLLALVFALTRDPARARPEIKGP